MLCLVLVQIQIICRPPLSLLPTLQTANWSILDMLMKANLAPSKKEGRRLVEQGGISVNDVKLPILQNNLRQKTLKTAILL